MRTKQEIIDHVREIKGSDDIHESTKEKLERDINLEVQIDIRDAQVEIGRQLLEIKHRMR